MTVIYRANKRTNMYPGFSANYFSARASSTLTTDSVVIDNDNDISTYLYLDFPGSFECGTSSMTADMVAIQSDQWQDATEGELPWLAYIKRQPFDSANHLCAGTLISPRHVLIWDRCLSDTDNAEDIRVVLGETVVRPSNPDVMVGKIIRYPCGSNGSSIGPTVSILELVEPVTLSDSVRP